MDKSEPQFLDCKSAVCEYSKTYGESHAASFAALTCGESQSKDYGSDFAQPSGCGSEGSLV
jgi:hypothetical protein